jgi:hypothetical protein
MGLFDYICCCFPRSTASIPEIDIIEPPLKKPEKLFNWKEFLESDCKAPHPSPEISFKAVKLTKSNNHIDIILKKETEKQ